MWKSGRRSWSSFILSTSDPRRHCTHRQIFGGNEIQVYMMRKMVQWRSLLMTRGPTFKTCTRDMGASRYEGTRAQGIAQPCPTRESDSDPKYRAGEHGMGESCAALCHASASGLRRHPGLTVGDSGQGWQEEEEEDSEVCMTGV